MLNVIAPSKFRSYSLPFVFLIAAFLRFYKLGHKQLSFDEILEIVHSAPTSIKDLLLAVTEDRGAAPLDYLVQHVFITLFGSTEFTARIHAAILGSLTIIAIYFLAKKISDPNVAFLTALLYAVYPLHQNYSQIGRPYALFTFLTVCSYLAFLNVLHKGKVRHWLGYTLCLVLLLYANYFGIFVVFSQIVFSCALLVPKVRDSFLSGQQTDRFLVVKLTIAATLAFLCFIPWIVFGIKTIYGYQVSPEVFNWHLIARLIREFSDRSYLLSFMLIVLAAGGVQRLILKEQYGQLLFLLFWTLLPLPLIFLLLWIKEYFFAIRQILFLTPAFYVLVAHGIMYLAESFARSHPHYRSKVKALITACLAVTSIGVIWLHIPDRNPDFKTASHFLRQNILPGDRVIAARSVEIFAYHFPEIREYTLASSALSDPGRAIAPGHRIFIIEYDSMGELDRRLINRVKADQRLLVEQSSDFRAVRVVKLQRPLT